MPLAPEAGLRREIETFKAKCPEDVEFTMAPGSASPNQTHTIHRESITSTTRRTSAEKGEAVRSQTETGGFLLSASARRSTDGIRVSGL